MRVVIAACSVDYSGRLDAHLALARRLILVKADGSVLVHADGGSYKPLNWMTAPVRMSVAEPDETDAAAGVTQVWTVNSRKTDDTLVIRLHEVVLDHTEHFGVDPGLVKDGVEAHLQALMADQIGVLGEGYTLVRREYPTAIGPVDILAKDPQGNTVAIEIKRVGGIDGVEQLSRYLTLLGRDPLLAPVRGVFAAQEIKPQARVVAHDRDIRCVLLDYDAMRGMDDPTSRLF